ncbi:hypothetical protein TWF192_003222 [Orbilia oligospora]|uniref:Carrier domain-containing protein n=1 Tax=Orbilia oligospora TaxID=2813651 RepID=A0A6G1MDD8_ORBOL|nr:hypothetical protein TWF679_007895 [Orbilia oligospora]KAF3225336.1 hypothetical protein TWF191_005387 [Orbilia oligospora]KAF3254461.1 hypothetical protein TWF192_003222 [Orbilia oligospora]
MARFQRSDDPNPILPSCGIIALFLHQVESFPSRLAFTDATEDTTVTYMELLEKVKKLARELRSKGPIPLESPIAILAAKGLDHIIAQLATIFVGGTCVPLDPSISDEQIKLRLEDAQPLYLVTDAENQNRHLGDFPTITVAHHLLNWPPTPDETCLPTTTFAGARSHIFYTSGTTGRPKGVEILAQGLYRVRHCSNIRPGDLVGHVTNPTFDVSTIDIWGTLTSGATIVNFNKGVLSSPFTFSEALQKKKSRVNWIFVTTSLLNIMAFSCPEAFSAVDILMTGGEAANATAMKLVLGSSGPPKKLINAYGPTECTIMSTYHEVTLQEAASGSVKIGSPVVGTDLYVLDDSLNPTPKGSIGELCVGGSCLALGYLNRPDATKKAFVSVRGLTKDNEPIRLYRTGDLVRYDGSGRILEYVGRKDNQIKIHGFRVELEGVEAAITNNCSISMAAVLKIPPPESDPGVSSFLLAFIVLKSGAKEGNLTEISKKLSQVLPWYSMPRLRVLDKFPLNNNGKVDRKILMEMYLKSIESAFTADSDENSGNTKTPTIRKLEAIWRETLAHPPSSIKPTDNYFALGGTSLQSATLILKIRKQFGVAISTDTLYGNPTLSAMAEYLDNGSGRDIDTKAAMQSDALLSENLRSLDGPIPDWRAAGEGVVLVTGATGFLGAYLVQALLRMPEVKKVHCLVRAKDATHALSRMKIAFSQYGISFTKQDQALMVAKLNLIPGDLGEQNLGLSGRAFDELARSCATIFHFGAIVNYVQPYSAHRAANTIGTLNIIRLAVTGRPKTVHYSSSLVVYGPTGLLKRPMSLSEDEPIDSYLDGLMYDIGYAQSQWVAEQLLWKSIKNGVPITIYRPGFVMGHSKTGLGNPNDFMGRFFVSCIKMGTYPLLPRQRKEFIPVDHCIRDILHISSSNANLGKAYAIKPLNLSESIDWNSTFKLLNRCGNFKLKGLLFSDWITSQPPETWDKRLLPLMPLLTEKVYGGKTRWEVYEDMAEYKTNNTRSALKDSKNPEGCSPLTKGLLKLYLKGWFKQTENSQLMDLLTSASMEPHC